MISTQTRQDHFAGVSLHCGIFTTTWKNKKTGRFFPATYHFYIEKRDAIE